MIMPDDNIFRLQWTENSVVKTLDTTPLNWGSMEMGLQREFLAIKREVTSQLTFNAEASEVITAAMEGNYPVTLTLYRRAQDWTMTLIRTWSSDMLTYKTDRGMVSVGFKSSTAREEIEKNKSTKYDIPLGTSRLIYSGIDNDATNIVSGVNRVMQAGNENNFNPSNWLLQGSHSTVEYSPMTFNNCSFTATDTRTVRVYIKLGTLSFFANAGADSSAKLVLSRFRNGVTTNYRTFVQDGSTFVNQVFTAVFQQSEYVYNDIPVIAGDIVRLFYSTTKRPTSLQQFTAQDLRFKVESQEHSPYTNYPIQADTMPTLIKALLAKICVVPPTLTYNLTENANYLPVLASAQSVSQTPNPIITLSFDDVMKCLFMLYGADYEVLDGLGDDLTLDVRPMTDLMSNTQAEVLDAVRGITVEYSSEHVHGTVKVGYETDENAKNGQYDPMCINTFKLGNSDAELDLVCPFKASPTTIEQFIRDKKTSSSTTKDSDTSVFLFCVAPFVNGDTTLYRGHTILSTPTPYLLNENYFNLPYSPMRILSRVGRYLKVSRWNIVGPIEFISTERTARLDSEVTGLDAGQCPEDSASLDLQLAMASPLFLPFNVSFDAVVEPYTKAEINERPRKYYTVTDINTLETYNLYINDLTLPLTKNVIGSFVGLRKYDMPT